MAKGFMHLNGVDYELGPVSDNFLDQLKQRLSDQVAVQIIDVTIREARVSLRVDRRLAWALALWVEPEADARIY